MIKFNLSAVQELINNFTHENGGGDFLINIEETRDGLELVFYDNDLANSDSGYSFVNSAELIMWCFEEYVSEYKYELRRINLSTLQEIVVKVNDDKLVLQLNNGGKVEDIETEYASHLEVDMMVAILKILEETNLDVRVTN